MNLRIFEVGAGSCALLVADNRNLMLFDCGRDDQIGFRPSSWLRSLKCTAIEHLVISNFDQDHVRDLTDIKAQFPIIRFIRNQSISVGALRRLKLEGGPLTDAITATLEMHERYVHRVAEPPLFPGIEFTTFCNNYPTFTDTNNLSLVSFVHTQWFSAVLPGDLETAGWRALLKNQAFVEHLKRVNIFVASHHGRVNGFCVEVFNYCKPDVILISDGPIQFETQGFDYAPFGKGIPDEAGNRRHVLTTRRHGDLTIEPKGTSSFIVHRQRS